MLCDVFAAVHGLMRVEGEVARSAADLLWLCDLQRLWTVLGHALALASAFDHPTTTQYSYQNSSEASKQHIHTQYRKTASNAHTLSLRPHASLLATILDVHSTPSSTTFKRCLKCEVVMLCRMSTSSYLMHALQTPQ